MRRTVMLLSTALLLGAIGCETPQPERAPPASVTPDATEPGGADVNIDSGSGRGVNIKVDVDPAPGSSSVNVDSIRPNDRPTAE